MATLIEKITEQIENMSSADLIALNNAYCDSASYSDDRIYDNDEDFLNENFSSISEAVRAASYGEYHYNHDYVKFNGYGNLESLSSIGTEDLVESVSTIIDYAIENQNDFDMLDFGEDEEESLTDED